MSNHKYGWIPQIPNHNDKRFLLTAIPIPSQVDLRPAMPPVYDQGQLGSCVWNASGAAFQFDQIKEGIESFTPSRLLGYYETRAAEGTIRSDSGCMIRDAIKVIATNGVCPEELWPYDISKFDVAPPASCYQAALQNKAIEYKSVVRNSAALMEVLAKGFPVIFGFTVYESFESAEVDATGIVPLPEAGEQALGGHAVLLVGYDKLKQTYIVRNSWGPDWGDSGYFHVPFSYLNATGANDFWVVQRVS